MVQLGYYAKDNDGDLYQFHWENERFFIHHDGIATEAKPNDYEILEIFHSTADDVKTVRTPEEVQEIPVDDPDTQNIVHLTLYKHPNGGMFAMDSSYLEQVLDDDRPNIPDPFGNGIDELKIE